MAFEISPAVERVAAAARSRAGGRAVRPADWLHGLLDDDDGRPAGVVVAAGTSPVAVREALAGEGAESEPAPPDVELFAAARDRGLALRADPTLTTDLLLLAVLEASPELSERVGLPFDAIARLLRTDDIGWEQPGLTVDHSVPTPVEVTDDARTAARAVDANLNRAREGLRVVEDYCRFVRDDRDRTERVKDVRHRLAAATAGLPAGALLAARDTPGDVGTTVTAGAEYVRGSPAEVAAVNLKRVQESLRSAEEFGKLFTPDFARAVEQVRYAAYELERGLFAESARRAKLAAAKLYLLIAADRCRHGLERTILEAVAGGVGVVQLREKSLSDRELLERANHARRVTRDAGVLFVVNDRPDIARLTDADGVHLGQDDMPVAAARRVVGPDVLVGVSTHSVLQVRKAVADGADYLGVGPTFLSRTKAFDAFPGPPFIRAATAITTLPTFALGGIDSLTVVSAVEAGAKRVAVASAITEADDPRAAAAELHGRLMSG
jgi:thiamine-phosphate pyrophosphorylase